jgi:hypothetical protein
VSAVVTAPNPVPLDAPHPWIFLAGSIERDRAERWQDCVIAALAGLPVTLLNPRRDAWDATWRQELDEPRFAAQVAWELDHLERADLIAWYAAPDTLSPISLLELGLHARSGKVVASCPPGYQRRGNVQAVCRRHGIPMHDGLEGLIADLAARSTSMAAAP